MRESHVLYRTEGHIAIITLNRPEAKNVFSPEMIALLSETQDHQEAAKSFLEKRKPIFVGK